MSLFYADEIRTQYLATLLARYATLHLPIQAGEHTLPLQTIFQPLTLRQGPFSFEDHERKKPESPVEDVLKIITALNGVEVLAKSSSQLQTIFQSLTSREGPFSFANNEHEKPEASGEDGSKVITALNGAEALAKSSLRRMVVLGGPGMGKTTLLKALLQQAIIQAQTEQAAPLPVFISLPDLARSGLSLQAYLPGILVELGIEAGYGDVLVEAVNDGRAFLCLDSLDEVVPARRPDMIELINHEAMRCGGTWIIGSRFTEYKGGQFVHSQFAEWELQALDVSMQVELARHLLPVLAELLQITPVPQAEHFVWMLGQETRIAAWGENPLLFSLTAIAYVQAGKLPGSRASLYHDIVEIMLGERFPEEPEREVLRQLLAEVALELYQTKGRNFTVAELLALLARLYSELSFQKQTEMVGRILDAGLLDRVAYETYGFKHQMFQEYLCAVALAHRLVSQDAVEQDAAWAFLWRKHTYSRWGEVLRLCVGVLVQEHGEVGNQAAGRWLLRLVDEQKTPEGDVGHLCLELALGSVRECSSVLYTDELTEVIKRLIGIWVDTLMQLLSRHRYFKGGRLERLADDVKMFDLHLVLPAIIRIEGAQDNKEQGWELHDSFDEPEIILKALGVKVPTVVLVCAYPETQGISLFTCLLPATLRAHASKEQLVGLLRNKEADWQVRRDIVSLLEAWEGQGLVELFCEVLEDTSNYYLVRIAAVYALEKLRERMPVERLVALLQDEDERIRVAIVSTLVKAGERVPIEILLMALNDKKCVYRIVQWAATNDSESVAPEPLLAALDSENDDVRIVVIYLLGSRMPTELLLAALQDPNREVRSAAVNAAGRSGERVPVTALLEILQDQGLDQDQDQISHLHNKVVEILCMSGKQIPVEAVFSYLWSENGFITHNEPAWLARLRLSVPVAALINLAQDPQRLQGALEMASALKIVLPVELLLNALGSQEYEIAEAAVRSLRSMGKDAPIPALLDIVYDESAPARSGAARALLLLAPHVPIEPILRLHAEIGTPPDLDIYLVCLLLRRGFSLPVASLVRVIKVAWDPFQYGRNEIAIALEDMGELVPVEDLLPLLSMSDNGSLHHGRIVHVLRNVYEWITPEKLLAEAGHNLVDECLALGVLGLMGTSAPIDFIKSIADDETRDKVLALQARHALLKAGVNLPLQYFFAERDTYFEIVGDERIKNMRDGTLCAMRDAAIAMLRDLGAQAPIQDLLDIVMSDDDRIASLNSLGLWGYGGDLMHQVATAALQELVPYLPLERLVEALDHHNPLVRNDVVEILSATGAAAPINKLIAMLHNPDEDRDVRENIVRALAVLHVYTPVEELIALLQDEEEDIRRFAAYSLKRWGSGLPLEVLLALIEEDDDEKYYSLEQYEYSMRDEAIMALGRLQERAPVDLLVSLLDSDAEGAAASALSYLGKDAPLDALIAHLYDADGDIRRNILEALIDLGEYAPLDLIMQLLHHEDVNIRQTIKYALESLAKAAPAKFVAMAKDDPHSAVRNALMLAIAKLGADAPVELALVALEDTKIYCNACLALSELDVDPDRIQLDILLKGLHEGYHCSLDLLVKLGTRVPVEPLLTLLGSSNTHTCAHVAETLYQTHPDVFAEVARQAEAILRGEPTGGVFASRVQSRVAELVRGIGRATPEVLSMLTEMLDWPYWEVQMKAAQALGAVSRNIPDQAIKRLTELRHASDSEAVREAADAALAEILSRESGLEDE